MVEGKQRSQRELDKREKQKQEIGIDKFEKRLKEQKQNDTRNWGDLEITVMGTKLSVVDFNSLQ